MKDASLVMLRDANMGPIFGQFQRPRARHCHLQCFDAPPLFVACLNTSVLLACCLCLVDRALTESAIVLTSGTCRTAVLTTPPEAVEARVP